MKIVFLNTLNAELKEPLTQFLRMHLADTDVFCLEECQSRMTELFPELFANFAKIQVQKAQLFRDEFFDNAMLVRKDWGIEGSGDTVTTANTGLAMYATLRRADMVVHIANVHGITRPGKLDTPERIAQSQEIIHKFATLDGAKIIGGDFNMLPETESAQLFVKAGYQDLIKNFNIKTTRNHIAWDKHPENPLYYSDYVFVQNAEVVSFEVPGEIVSDHQPMILTVNI